MKRVGHSFISSPLTRTLISPGRRSIRHVYPLRHSSQTPSSSIILRHLSSPSAASCSSPLSEISTGKIKKEIRQRQHLELLEAQHNKSLEKRLKSSRSRAAAAIPPMLVMDPDYFLTIMKELKLDASGSNSHYRDIFLDSIPSFGAALADEPESEVLDRLVSAGFSDLEWAKKYRAWKKQEIVVLARRKDIQDRKESMARCNSRLESLNTDLARTEAEPEMAEKLPFGDSKSQARVRIKNSIIGVHQELTSLKKSIQKLEAHVNRGLTSPGPSELHETADGVMKSVLLDLRPRFAEHIAERHARIVARYRSLSAKTDLTKPHEWYAHARLDRRKIVFHGGPTNSGKTYAALERLKTAKKGLYVGPLRLLAAEVYENLTSQGIYCNLFTGQEKREIPFATHTAATVEMTPTDVDFDIVVIDEIQMLNDPFRGWAWTHALQGVRCKEVHVCGGMEGLDIVKKIVGDCGDQFELKKYSRFSELTIAKKSLANGSLGGSYKNVQQGDCVVAFSRSDIFAIKREIETKTHHKCCVIYGRLPPETRTDQARRFNDPDSGYDILIASDAIGMGLNLNIKRIIFNSMFKSDGEQNVRLDHSHVKQIGGRAGRRNSPFPVGEVTCRDPADMKHLQTCMTTEVPPVKKAGLLPTATHVELFSDALQELYHDENNLKLNKILRQFGEMATLQGDFFLCRQTPMRMIATALDSFDDLSLSDKYTLCMAPVNTNDQKGLVALQKYAMKYTSGETAGCGRNLIPRKPKSFHDLSNLCSIFNQLELFLWLTQKYPGNIVEQHSALALKERTIHFINEGLANSDKLKLEHCYVQRDKKIRANWAQRNAESIKRGIVSG